MGITCINIAKPLVYIAFTLLLLLGCNQVNNNKEAPIARVFDKYLYLSDIQDIFPESASAADSAVLIKAYAERWVRRQLMVNRAERHLTEAEKDVSKQLDDYRSSLLVFKYEQEYIRQKLDPEVTQQEVERFYAENISNFILNENLVKALFIKLRKDDASLPRIKSLYRSTIEDDIKALDNLAYQVAVKFDHFNDDWIPFSVIAAELPEMIPSHENFLTRNSYISMEDSNFAYLVSIREVLTRGQISPLSHEFENVESIILNKRKHQIISDLEARIYNDALNHNHFAIHID